jgi:type I restriction enzyme S subunit
MAADEGRTTGDELPEGWVWTTLGDACLVNPSMSWPKSFAEDTLVSFVPMAAVDDVTGAIVAAEPRPIGEIWRGYKRFAEGDVIFARITPCMENGKAAIATGLTNGIGMGSTEFHVLRPTDAVSAEWVYYFVRQQSFRSDAARQMTGTAGQLRVPKAFLEESPIPLAPLAEQRRIIARIEALFQESRRAREALDRVSALIARFRQSVLAAAFRGDLTERDPDDEPASALLARILAERRRWWEEDLRAQGKDPERHKYGEPALPDTSDLPELPEGWVWATTAQLSASEKYSMAIGPFGSNLLVKDYRGEGVPLIFVRNIRSGVFDGPDTRYVTSEKAEELCAHRVDGGDILVTKMGDPPGDACLYPKSSPSAITTSDGIKWRLSPLLPEGLFFVHCINSSLVREQIIEITQGVAQQKMSLGRFKTVAVPLAPLAEQQRIVRRIEALFAQASAVEAAVPAARQRLDRLDQAILARAFRGELVSSSFAL